MSEQSRDPLIRLPIDQEVFAEVAGSGDTVEDATVTTEVVSFRRDGDVYELEGAVVFAGYINKASRVDASEETSFSVGIEDEAGTVEHVHHRLPFTLRVPVSAQSSGLVNVKSRLSGFELGISAENWLNVKGLLEIHGLVGDEGYHFRCGAQEAGDSMITEVTEEVVAQAAEEVAELHQPSEEVVAQVAEEVAELHQPSEEVSEEPLELVGAGEPLWRHQDDEESTAGSDDFASETEEIAELHQPVEQVKEEPAQPEDIGEPLWRHEERDDSTSLGDDSRPVSESVLEIEAPEVQGRAGDAVENNDRESTSLERVNEARAGNGWAHTDSDDQLLRTTEEPKANRESARSELANLDRFFAAKPTEEAPVVPEKPPSDGTPIASFEFEHQLDSESVDEPVAREFDPLEETMDSLRGNESWMPKFSISGSVATEDHEVAQVGSEPEAQPEEDFERGEEPIAGVVKNTLWSFVDFNGPEPRHTLRYVIVMEEETLEAVADRCGCLSSELQRVNSWTNGQVVPGQALYIPSKPYTVTKLTTA